MLRKLLAGLIIGMGAQLLLPPVFDGDFAPDLWGPDSFGLAAESRAVMAAELSEIRDRGHLIVGIKTNRPPLGFIDESGNLSGFEIDIAHRLATDLLGDENAVQFVPLSNVDRLSAVLDGRVDMAIAAITLTEPRRRIVHFSDPYYLDGTGFIVQSAIETLPDLRFGRIAVLSRSSTIAHVRYILPSSKLTGVDTYAEAQALLTNGDVDAFAGDVSVLTGWINAVDGMDAFSVLPNVISAEPLSIATPKGTNYRELQTAVNQSIRRWYTEDWLQARADFWALPSGILPSLLDAQSELDADMESDQSQDQNQDQGQ